MWQPRSLGESKGSGTDGGCSVPPRPQASLRRAAGPPAAGIPVGPVGSRTGRERGRAGGAPIPSPSAVPRSPCPRLLLQTMARNRCRAQRWGAPRGPPRRARIPPLPALAARPEVGPGRAGDSRGRRLPALARAGPAQTKRGPRPGPVRRAGAGTGGGEPGTPPAAPPAFVCRGSRGRRGAQRGARPVLPGGSVHKGRRRRGQRGGGGGRAHQSVGLSSPITSW